MPTDQPVFTDFLVPFVGSTPESLGQLKNLKELRLFSNQLSGRDSLVSPVGGPHSTREIEGAAVALQRKRRAKKMRKFRLWWGIGVLRRGLGVQ